MKLMERESERERERERETDRPRQLDGLYVGLLLPHNNESDGNQTGRQCECHTHTHTHTHRERERDRPCKSERGCVVLITVDAVAAVLAVALCCSVIPPLPSACSGSLPSVYPSRNWTLVRVKPRQSSSSLFCLSPHKSSVGKMTAPRHKGSLYSAFYTTSSNKYESYDKC